MRDNLETVWIRKDEELKRRAKAAASLEGKTFADFITDAIMAYVEEVEKKFERGGNTSCQSGNEGGEQS